MDGRCGAIGDFHLARAGEIVIEDCAIHKRMFSHGQDR